MYYWKPALDKLVKALLEAHGEDTATWPELADNDPRLAQRHKEYTSIRHVHLFLSLSCRASESNSSFSHRGLNIIDSGREPPTQQGRMLLSLMGTGPSRIIILAVLPGYP